MNDNKLGPLDCVEVGNKFLESVNILLQNKKFSKIELVLFLSALSTQIVSSLAEHIANDDYERGKGWIDMIAKVSKKHLKGKI
jgi:hypothetical protein